MPLVHGRGGLGWFDSALVSPATAPRRAVSQRIRHVRCVDGGCPRGTGLSFSPSSGLPWLGAGAGVLIHDGESATGRTFPAKDVMAARPSKATKSPRAAKGSRRRKPGGASTGLLATELSAVPPPAEVTDLCRQIEQDGGHALSVYREPYGGRWLLFAALPIERVAATPYQRNLSDPHVRKLEAVIGKLGRFLDPIIAVRAGAHAAEGVRYWTPNGHHRLSAMKTLGAQSITAIVVPEASAAYQILALNTEKAHNLREKALEVIRMYRELVRLDGQAAETDYVVEFEEPSLATLGLCYEERPRFSGGAYHPVLKRLDAFVAEPLAQAWTVRQARAARLMALDDLVVQQVEALKAKGLTSPYLKSFVVARINPIRFRPKDAPAPAFDKTFDSMAKAAAAFDVGKIKMEDLARSGGAPDEGD